MEPGDIDSRDKIHFRTNKRHNQTGRSRRHMSVEGLYLDDYAGMTSEEDHLARVSDLKSFFENLNKTDTPGKADILLLSFLLTSIVNPHL